MGVQNFNILTNRPILNIFWKIKLTNRFRSSLITFKTKTIKKEKGQGLCKEMDESKKNASLLEWKGKWNTYQIQTQ